MFWFDIIYGWSTVTWKTSDINKISADVITDLAKTTAQTVYKKL